jgi:hypothetical protein
LFSFALLGFSPAAADLGANNGFEKIGMRLALMVIRLDDRGWESKRFRMA